jgi:hypothetical protein
MLQAADLTIRLNAADDVVIARVEFLPALRCSRKTTCAPRARSPPAQDRRA